MSQYVIEDSTLTAIADAVRDKTGDSEKIKVKDIPTAIAGIETGSGSGGLTAKDLTFSGDLGSYFCSGQIGKLLLDNYKDLMSFNNITAGQYLFNKIGQYDLSDLTLNFNDTTGCNFQALFNGTTIVALPKLVGKIQSNQYTQYPFGNALYIREIPYSVYENLDTSLLEEKKNFGIYNLFNYTVSLKEYPEDLVNKLRAYINNSTYAGYYSTFNYCTSLSEITNLFINPSTLTSNCFSNTFYYCGRVKDITFETNEDGTPMQANWKSQVISLDTCTGYVGAINLLTSYNSGITTATQVTDDESYAALKDDPDWWTSNSAYSRYNHDSAVRTINSLPDTSAYLATAGGTNTIKFKGAAGSATDGGAINTLTEEEIAVATAKGWTVTLV